MARSTGGGTPQRAAKRTAGHLDRRGRPRFRPSELLIRIKPDLPGPQIAALHESLGARILSRMDRHRLQRLQLEEGADEDLAIERYLDSGLVDVAERHVLMYPAATLPDDPYFFQQWGLPVIQAPEKPGISMAAPVDPSLRSSIPVWTICTRI